MCEMACCVFLWTRCYCVGGMVRRCISDGMARNGIGGTDLVVSEDDLSAGDGGGGAGGAVAVALEVKFAHALGFGRGGYRWVFFSFVFIFLFLGG